MAKKTTSKKKGASKRTKKSPTKGKSKVTKKKTSTKKITTKKKAVPKKAVPKKAAKAVAKKKVATKKTAVKKTEVKKKTAPKKAVKAVAKKKVVAKKAAVLKKKTAVKKTAAKKKTAPKKAVKAVAKKKTAIKKSVPSKPKKRVASKSAKEPIIKSIIEKKPVLTRGEAIKRIKGYGKKELEQFRAIILEKRDEILEDLQSLKEQMLDPTTGEYINENSPYSLHMAEQGTDAMEREKTFLYAQRENKFLGYLDDALKRIDTGTYGICIECVEEPQHLCETCPLVPKARLAAVPHTQHCLPIKQRTGGR
jgi:RNA polymerase-binding transcription factor DksA